MSKFYFFLWLQWAVRMSISSVVIGAFFSLIIGLCIQLFYTYFMELILEFKFSVLQALIELSAHWFPLVWRLTLFIALFRSLKHIFNTCYNGYELKLLECNGSDTIEIIGYGDLVKVWRRWFMLMIWLTGIQILLAVGIRYMFGEVSELFEWLNIYILFIFILISGYFSFILLGGRCKKVKVVKC